MTTGSWSPQGEQNKQAIEIKPEWLQQFIQISENNQLDNIASLIEPSDQTRMAGLMRLESEAWMQAAQSLKDEEIIHLVHFFTVAEMQLPDWNSGDKSPVIWLAKVLKQRNKRLNKEQLLWIRENSNNRFLPYGSIL
jgi:hypothetical protein